MRLEVGTLPFNLRDVIGFGGVALADVEYLVIRENLIANNGRSSLDPICGVFVLHGAGIAIDGNRILHNGQPAEEDQQPRPGRRGGIVLAFARARAVEQLSVAVFNFDFTGLPIVQNAIAVDRNARPVQDENTADRIAARSAIFDDQVFPNDEIFDVRQSDAAKANHVAQVEGSVPTSRRMQPVMRFCSMTKSSTVMKSGLVSMSKKRSTVIPLWPMSSMRLSTMRTSRNAGPASITVPSPPSGGCCGGNGSITMQPWSSMIM